MAMLTRLDMGSGFTQFFLIAAVLLLVVSVLLSRVSGGKKSLKRRSSKVDDRFVETEGELID